MVGELTTSTQLCIVEKTIKIVGGYSEYSERWLVLVNRIDSDFYPSEWAEIRAPVSILASWSKVFPVSGVDQTDAIEL